jgi:hypothetical protein
VSGYDTSSMLRWLGPWACFVLFLGAGRVLTGGHTVGIDELVLGMPLGWLAGWAATRGFQVAAVGVALAGLLVGLLA